MAKFAVIVPAAGRSTRFGDAREKKIYRELDGRAVWLRAIEPFVGREDVGEIIVAIAADDREMFERRYRPSVAFLNIKVIDGGAERVDSVAAGLAMVSPDCDYIAIHDAARPCLTPAVVDRVFAAAVEHGAAIPAMAVVDTLKRASQAQTIQETIPRAGIYAAQTPQVFRRDILERAYEARSSFQGTITDDAQLVESMGLPVAIVEGSAFNIKLTTQADLELARVMIGLIERENQLTRPAHPYAAELGEWASPPPRRAQDLFGD